MMLLCFIHAMISAPVLNMQWMFWRLKMSTSPPHNKSPETSSNEFLADQDVYAITISFLKGLRPSPDEQSAMALFVPVVKIPTAIPIHC